MPPSPRELLRERFGFPAFRPGQEALIRAVMTGRDALGVLPTGGGKTLCFQIPALAMDGAVVVVSPLISLMKDQVERARAVGLDAASVTSVDGADSQRATLERLRRGTLDLLFLSPERLATGPMRALFAEARVSLLAVDEAHCISEWGHDFRPAFRDIARVRPLLGTPVLAVTATATPAVRDDIVRVLGLEAPRVVVTSFDRPNIFWKVETVSPGEARIRRIATLLRRPGTGQGATIVYAPTRRLVVGLRRALAALGFGAEAYHAGMTAEERDGVQARFLGRRTNLIVATNAFGMGIDRGDVLRVIHYALPGSVESYYQEAGRAGRDGDPSRAVAFVDRSDWSIPRAFIDQAFPAPRAVKRVLGRLEAAGRRRSGALEGADLVGEADAHVPALKWLIREGALQANDALRLLAAEGREALRDRPGTPRARLTGRGPDLGRLRAGRAQARERLRAIRVYVRSRGCRRKALLRYLGEVPEWRACAFCDRCGRSGEPRAQ